jgi:hypothetical protein
MIKRQGESYRNDSEREKSTMLDAIGTPLALGDFAKYRKPLIEQLIDNSILSFGFKDFKRVL